MCENCDGKSCSNEMKTGDVQYSVEEFWTPSPRVSNMGWQCPSCNSVYSPTVQMCWFCGGNNTITVTNVTYDLSSPK